MGMPDERAFRDRIGRVEALIRQSEALPDPVARECIREIVQTLMDFHGAGLARILDHLAEGGEPGRAALDALAGDELVGSLLLLYGLHPLGIEERVRAALEKLRPRLHAQGGDVELVGVADGVVRLRMEGSADASMIEEAVYEAAPDAVSVEVMGDPEANGRAHGRYALPLVRG